LRTGPRAPLLRDEPRALRRRSTRRRRPATAIERRRDPVPPRRFIPPKSTIRICAR
jgi:hypothetical protein